MENANGALMNTNLYDELRSDFRVVWIGVFAVVAAAWIYLFSSAMTQMHDSGGDQMQMQPAWTLKYASAVLEMWAVMMVAMMLPVSTPATLLAVRGTRSAPQSVGRLLTTVIFTSAYMLVWLIFSVLATLLQWVLASSGLLSDDMAIRNHLLGGSLTIAVGLYQFSAFKLEALRRCRSSDECNPKNLNRSESVLWMLGLCHGYSCLSCCWALMLLPFIGGLMNPVWMAAAMIQALVERIDPKGDCVARVGGAGLIALGGYVVTVAV